MKPRIFTSILLFISAYSPLFIILAVKDFDFKLSHRFNHPLGIILILTLTFFSIILLYVSFSRINRGNMVVKIISVKNRSLDLINYTIPYILAFFGFDLSKPEDIISLSIFLIILLILTIKSKSIFINPILALMGYGLYDIEYEFENRIYDVAVLSKIDLRRNDYFFIRSLTHFLYLVKEKVEGKSNGY